MGVLAAATLDWEVASTNLYKFFLPIEKPTEMAPVSEANDTVLIVDDDSAVRTALKELFETEGYAVAVASNGRAALNHLGAGLRPCVVLLDLMMPVMDGWDFRTEQLKDPVLKEIPVFIITAAGFSNQTIRVQFGDIPFVPKPPPHEELLAMVERVCRERRRSSVVTPIS
jgi:CheY-like chemotaxis protein